MRVKLPVCFYVYCTSQAILQKRINKEPVSTSLLILFRSNIWPTERRAESQQARHSGGSC